MWGRSSSVGKGGTGIFSHSQRGDQYFFTHAKGGTRKNWRPAITNRRSPLPLKNDSSLSQWLATLTNLSLTKIWLMSWSNLLQKVHSHVTTLWPRLYEVFLVRFWVQWIWLKIFKSCFQDCWWINDDLCKDQFFWRTLVTGPIIFGV